jgi:hypothetical protein
VVAHLGPRSGAEQHRGDLALPRLPIALTASSVAARRRSRRSASRELHDLRVVERREARKLARSRHCCRRREQPVDLLCWRFTSSPALLSRCTERELHLPGSAGPIARADGCSPSGCEDELRRRGLEDWMGPARALFDVLVGGAGITPNRGRRRCSSYVDADGAGSGSSSTAPRSPCHGRVLRDLVVRGLVVHDERDESCLPSPSPPSETPRSPFQAICGSLAGASGTRIRTQSSTQPSVISSTSRSTGPDRQGCRLWGRRTASSERFLRFFR